MLAAWFQFPPLGAVTGRRGGTAGSSHYIHIAHVFARLNPGASPADALQEVSAVQSGLYTPLRGSGEMEQGVAGIPLERYGRRRKAALRTVGSGSLPAPDRMP